MSPQVTWREEHPDLFFIEFEGAKEPVRIDAHHAFDLHSALGRAFKRRADWRLRGWQEMAQRNAPAPQEGARG